MFSRVTSTALCILVAVTDCALSQTQTLPGKDKLPAGMELVIRDFDRIATEAARGPDDTGYTLGVVTRDGLAWTESYGYSDSARKAPANSETAYGIGCGAFTAIMLLQLTQAGRVHFSDPVSKYLPEMRLCRVLIPMRRPSRCCSWHFTLPGWP